MFDLLALPEIHALIAGLTLGGWAFVTFIALLFFIPVACNKQYVGAGFVVGIFLAAYFTTGFNILTFATKHPVELTMFVIEWFLVGTVWSLFLAWLAGLLARLKHNRQVKQFCDYCLLPAEVRGASRMISGGILDENRINVAVRDHATVEALKLGQIPDELISSYRLHYGVYDVVERLSDTTDTIITRVVFWPWSMAWRVTHALTHDIAAWIVARLGVTYRLLIEVNFRGVDPRLIRRDERKE